MLSPRPSNIGRYRVRVLPARDQVQFVGKDVHRRKGVSKRDVVYVHDLIIAHFNGILELKPPAAVSLRCGVRRVQEKGMRLKRHFSIYHLRE